MCDNVTHARLHVTEVPVAPPIFPLETARLRIRPLRDDDAPAMYAFCREPALTRYTSWEHHADPDVARAFIRDQHAAAVRGLLPVWAIADRETDALRGAIGLYDHLPAVRRAEFGFWVGGPHQGRGIAVEAARAVVAYGFEAMDLVRVQAICHVENGASARVLERAGLACEGTLRRYAWKRGAPFDVRMYAAIAP
jgi:ribosomal-protein-alanine N-acetyltransferase